MMNINEYHYQDKRNEAKKERYAAVTNWRINQASMSGLILPDLRKYIIQIRFPHFFQSLESTLNFAQNNVVSLHYYEQDQKMDYAMSIIDMDYEEFCEEFEKHLPYFSLDLILSSGKIDEGNTVGNNYTNIYQMQNSQPVASNLTLLEYAHLLPDKCEFEKLLAGADVIAFLV